MGSWTPRALDALIMDYARYPLDWSRYFPPGRDRWLEIGFGRGEFLLQTARRRPDLDLVGIESSWISVKKVLTRLDRLTISNVKILYAGADWCLRLLFPNESFRRVWMLFPDPWPKARHASHRLGSPGFFISLYRVLADPGGLTFVTDDKNYLRWFMNHVPEKLFTTQSTSYRDRPRFGTKYERKWLAQGKTIYIGQLTKQSGVRFSEPRTPVMNIHRFSGRIRPERIPSSLKAHQGTEVTAVVKGFHWDARNAIGLFRVVVREGSLVQRLFVELRREGDTWVLTPSDQCFILPTAGLQFALDEIFQAVMRAQEPSLGGSGHP